MGFGAGLVSEVRVDGIYVETATELAHQGKKVEGIPEVIIMNPFSNFLQLIVKLMT